MKNAKITIAASVATAYTEAARDIANKRRATPMSKTYEVARLV